MIYYRLRAASVLVCKGGTCKLSGFGFVQDITDRNLHETVSAAPLHFLSFQYPTLVELIAYMQATNVLP